MLIKYERERTLTNKIRSEKVEVKTDSTEIQKITREYHEHAKLDNLEEMDKFLVTFSLSGVI